MISTSKEKCGVLSYMSSLDSIGPIMSEIHHDDTHLEVDLMKALGQVHQRNKYIKGKMWSLAVHV